MIPEGYSKHNISILNKINIPKIIDPFDINVYWFRPVSYENKGFISSKEHIHTFFEVHFVLNGKMQYGFHDKNCIVSEREGLIIPPYVKHTVKSYSDDFIKFSLAFSLNKETSLYKNILDKGAKTFSVSYNILQSTETILKESIENSVFSATVIRNRITEIIYNITSAIGIVEYDGKADLYIEDNRVTNAKLYISDNINSFLTCADVSKHCHLSTKQMDRLFIKNMGMHLMEYIHSVKIKEAEKLLEKSDYTINQISEKLGFSNVYYFSNFFNRHVGMPPGYYRKIKSK